MKQIFLEGKKSVELEDKSVMELEYYLIENQKNEELDKALYGVKIAKRIGDYTESEEVDAISYSKEFVKQILDKLMENEVTPISMIEIIDDLVTIRLCS